MNIISIELINNHYENEYVYDLETEVGTFVAGGLKTGILVKNTDSCYVKFPLHRSDYESEDKFMEAQFEIAQNCAKKCTSNFKPPMELAFEKYMFPLILFKKKRYAYIEWTNPKQPNPEPCFKGIQVVRRDTCRYVKEELEHIFDIIMKERSKEAAFKQTLDYTKQSVKKLLDGTIDPNKLILSKQLKARYKVRKNNTSHEYHWTNKDIQQPHVRLAQELRQQDPANHPKPPDRVPYLFIEKKGNNLLQCDKVIHPMYFNPNIHKIDSIYYFDHQFQKPIDMIFKFMMPNPENVYKSLRLRKLNEIAGQVEITTFFKPKNETAKKIFEYKPIDETIIESESETEELEEPISEDLFS